MSENFVTVGQGIPNRKSFWDKLIRMVNAESGTVTTPSPQLRAKSQTVVRMINRTGRTLKPGDWCEIDEEKFGGDEDKFFGNRPTVTGVAITDNETTRRLACALKSIRENGTGDAVVFGVCQTRVMMVQTNHQYAQPAAGEHSHLESTEDVTPYRIMSDTTTAAVAAGSVVPRNVLIGSAGGGGEPGSSIVLAQAQPGGIPKRTGIVMGFGRARLLEQIDNGIADINPLELTRDITVVNPSFRVAGQSGDRLIWLSDNSDGAMVIGWDEPNEGDPTAFQQRQPESAP